MLSKSQSVYYGIDSREIKIKRWAFPNGKLPKKTHALLKRVLEGWIIVKGYTVVKVIHAN